MTSGLEVVGGAELEIAIGERIDKGLTGLTRRLAPALDALAADLRAVPLSVFGSAAAPATGPAIIDVGGPAQGRWWELSTVAVLGDDDRTAIADTMVALYVTGKAASNMLPPLSDLVLPGTQGGSDVTVPANAQFGRRQVVAVYPMHFVVLVYGASSGQSLTSAVRGWDRDTEELPIR